ncbi:hypothetical protein ETH_00004010 [Eimeria tenella]|uniref:Dynein heavy chain C-terminal domain-containing protein n=1 Tax=Eimeria tenella TaxID=5802 RepID=U6KW00_EIMTE|nr:hypothetical protein ETH_00004010 [Eimeria tenella]CDJ42146.1 hypothetical protein ETH_00004010 [Eimeria tenella]|eukprot:XP_013232896.1 hypothetical protein ETH_00004010 [Eimeria tenella]
MEIAVNSKEMNRFEETRLLPLQQRQPKFGVYIHGLSLEGGSWDLLQQQLSSKTTSLICEPFPVMFVSPRVSAAAAAAATAAADTAAAANAAAAADEDAAAAEAAAAADNEAAAAAANEAAADNVYSCPVYATAARGGPENCVLSVPLPTAVPSSTCILRGTALLLEPRE